MAFLKKRFATGDDASVGIVRTFQLVRDVTDKERQQCVRRRERERERVCVCV